MTNILIGIIVVCAIVGLGVLIIDRAMKAREEAIWAEQGRLREDKHRAIMEKYEHSRQGSTNEQDCIKQR